MPTEEPERPKKTERLISCRSSKSWGNTELLNEWLFLLNECHWVCTAPANPLIARRTLKRRRRKTQQPQPATVHRRHVANRVADLAQRSKIVMLLHQLLEFTLPLAFDRRHRQRGVVHSGFLFQTAMARSLNEFLPIVQLWTYLYILEYESAIDNFAIGGKSPERVIPAKRVKITSVQCCIFRKTRFSWKFSMFAPYKRARFQIDLRAL